MLTLPEAIAPLLVPFATLFSAPTWRKAQVLLVGAVLTPGQRTVAAVLRIMGRSDQLDYARYHEVLNRAVWSPRAVARILLGLFSWTTLAAHALQKRHPITQRTAAWYDKPSPTFVDAIALVRRHLWLASEGFSLSAADPDVRELPATLYHRMADCLSYAA